MPNPIIKVSDVSKTFTYFKKPEGFGGTIRALFRRERLTKEAVKDVSFSIEKGEFVGFVGPNGAGKTTTLKMLSGILYPTAGSVRVAGFDPSRRQESFKKQISLVMGQKSMLFGTLPPIETLVLLQKIYEVPEAPFRKRLKDLSEMLEVTDLMHVQTRKLSLGQRMRFELIASLLHKPQVLFLDEPTIGLDVVSKKRIRKFLREQNEREKTTIILTSHDMDDVQDLCSRLIIINEGRVGYDGSITKIIEEYSRDKSVRLRFAHRVARSELDEIGRVVSFSPYEAEIAILPEEVREKIGLLVSQFPVKDISIASVTLEEVITDLFAKR